MKRPYVTLRLDKGHKANQRPGKRYPIMAEVYCAGKIKRKPTGIKAAETEWDVRKGRIIKGKDRDRDNEMLMFVTSQYQERIDEFFRKTGGHISFSDICSILDGEAIMRKDNGTLFLPYVFDELARSYKIGKIGKSRYDNGISAMRVFELFLRANKLPQKFYLGDIRPELISDYISWRRDVKGNSIDTITHALQPIMGAVATAARKGLIDSDLYDSIVELRPARATAKPVTEARYLSDKEFEELCQFYEQDTEKRRKEFVEMFLFSANACGIRLSDVATLQWRDIDWSNKTIVKVIQKNKAPLRIMLNETALAILKRWKCKTAEPFERRSKGQKMVTVGYPYVFDLVPSTLDRNNQEEVQVARNNADRCVNQALKVVGIHLGLSFPLTFHAARHTWAMTALNSGIPLTMVSQALGHSTAEITQKIYAWHTDERMAEMITQLSMPVVKI